MMIGNKKTQKFSEVKKKIINLKEKTHFHDYRRTFLMFNDIIKFVQEEKKINMEFAENLIFLTKYQKHNQL